MIARLFAPLCLVSMAACSHHVAPFVQPVAQPGIDTVSYSRAPDVIADGGDNTPRVYRGVFSSGFEVSWFQPCHGTPGDATWWVTLTEDARMQRDSLARVVPKQPSSGVVVEWLATLSPRMPMGAGHMGRGTRYMLVSRVLAIRTVDANGMAACGVPSETDWLRRAS